MAQQAVNNTVNNPTWSNPEGLPTGSANQSQGADQRAAAATDYSVDAIESRARANNGQQNPYNIAPSDVPKTRVGGGPELITGVTEGLPTGLAGTRADPVVQQIIDTRKGLNANVPSSPDDTGAPDTAPSTDGGAPSSGGSPATGGGTNGGTTPAAAPVSDPMADLIAALQDRMNPTTAPGTGTGSGNPDQDALIAALTERMNQPRQSPDEIAAQRQALLDALVGDYPTAQIDRINYYDPQRLIDLLDQRIAAATQQANQQIDYATKNQAEDLNRALQGAQSGFQSQMNSIAADEMNALDNSALYAEMRGDRGGIGQAQYNSIQNTAAQNRVSVQQAQQQLTTDTARQIADLRAQGEFQKADALLDLTQKYLSELSNIEQYAASHNLTVDQVNTEIAKWEQEFNANRQQYINGLDLSLAELTGRFSDGTQTFAARQQTEQALANMTMSLLQSGVSPDQLSDEQLAALGAQYGMNPQAVASFAQQIADENARTQNSQMAATAMDLIQAGISPDQLSDAQLQALSSVYGMDAKGVAALSNSNGATAAEKSAAEMGMAMLQAGMTSKQLSDAQRKAMEKVYGADADTLATYAGLLAAANKSGSGSGWDPNYDSNGNPVNDDPLGVKNTDTGTGTGGGTTIRDMAIAIAMTGGDPSYYLRSEVNNKNLSEREYQLIYNQAKQASGRADLA